MKRSIIAWLLILSIMVFQGSAFAKTDSAVDSPFITESMLKTSIINSIINKVDVNQKSYRTVIEEDIEALNRCGIPIMYLKDIDIQNGSIVYILDIPSATETAFIKVQENNFEEIEIDITEGICHDVIIFRDDGKIILNGSEVTVSINESYESTYSRNTTRARYSEYSSSPFISGAYNSYIGTSNYILDTGNSFIKDLSVTVIASIIGYKIGGIPGTIASGIFSVVAGQMKRVAAQYCPTSTAGSCTIKQYENTNHSNTLDHHYKYVGDYYANSNYTVYVGESTYYEYNYYS